MKWLEAAWNALRKAPIAKYFRALWKGGLKMAVEHGGDTIQAELRGLIEREGTAAFQKVNDRIDGLQARFKAFVDGLPFPPQVEVKIERMVNVAVDELQNRLRAGMESGKAENALAAFDAAFDQFQAGLKDKIDAL